MSAIAARPDRHGGQGHGFQRRTLHLVAAAVVLAYAPIDLLVAEVWTPRLLATRLAWAASLAGAGELMRRTKSPQARLRLGFATAATTPALNAVIVGACGSVGNPMYSWLAAIPIFSVMVSQEQIGHAVVAAVSAVASTIVVVALGGGSARVVVAYGLLVAGAGALGIGSAGVFRIRKAAERAARCARTEAEARLAESEGRRAQAERLAIVGQLAAGVAHEINNPLAFVSANLRYLEEDAIERTTPREELDAIFRETRDGVTRIGRIVENLRVFANDAEAGAGGCQVSEAVHEATRLVSPRLEDKVRLEVSIARELPETSVGSRQLSEALVSLLMNAADAVEETAAERRAVIHVTGAARNGGVEVVVEDNGPGISGPALAHLFEPFFTTKGPRKGTGLGLAVAREQLKRYGGTIEGQNRPGGGARFVLWLPVTRA